jgi:hypothetical protein
MTVYIDALFTARAREKQAHRVGARNGHRWCHMIADTVEELHRFARRIGLKREWFQDTRNPHYDLTPGRRALALRLGAVELPRREFVMKMCEVRDESGCDRCGRPSFGCDVPHTKRATKTALLILIAEPGGMRGIGPFDESEPASELYSYRFCVDCRADVENVILEAIEQAGRVRHPRKKVKRPGKQLKGTLRSLDGATGPNGETIETWDAASLVKRDDGEHDPRDWGMEDDWLPWEWWKD